MASLRVHIEEIPEEGLEFTRQVSRDELLLEEDDPSTLEEFTVSASVQLTGSDVLARGEFVGTLQLACVRCLDHFLQPFHLSFEGNFSPAEEGRSSGVKTAGRGEDEHTDELERYVIQDESVDLGSLLREQVILTVPIQPLCAPDCKGLCAQCGEDLNVKPCTCPPGDLGSPFAVLKNLVKLSEKSRTSS